MKQTYMAICVIIAVSHLIMFVTLSHVGFESVNFLKNIFVFLLVCYDRPLADGSSRKPADVSLH